MYDTVIMYVVNRSKVKTKFSVLNLEWVIFCYNKYNMSRYKNKTKTPII